MIQPDRLDGPARFFYAAICCSAAYFFLVLQIQAKAHHDQTDLKDLLIEDVLNGN